MKNLENNDESIDAFFENGKSFPQFISLIFINEKIQNICQNPKNIFQKQANNDATLKFLCKNNDFIKKSNPSLNTTIERSNLLQYVLTKLCFTVNTKELIDKSNLLLKDANINSKKDLLNPLFILRLLNVLTDNRIQIEPNVTRDNFGEIMSKSFEIAKVPFFISFDSMKYDPDILLIQIQFIFDAYSEKINDLLQIKSKNSEEGFEQTTENTNKLIESNSKQITENTNKLIENNPKLALENTNEFIESYSETRKNDKKGFMAKQNTENDEKESNENDNQKIMSINVLSLDQNEEIKDKNLNKEEMIIESKQTVSDEIIDEIENTKDKLKYKYCEEEWLEEQSLLKTINFLTQKLFPNEQISFTSFNETLKNDFIPKFVMKFLNIASIENVDLIPSSTNPNKLTNKNIQNILSVINFLKRKKYEYQILVFNFTTTIEREASAKLFFKSFLNLFFVTNSRIELKKRLNIISSNSNDKLSLSKNPHYNLIIQSMKFLTQKPNKLNSNLSEMYKMCLEHFSIANVFTEQQLNVISHEKVYPDTYYYQLQLLFNQWDSYKSFHVAEKIFTALFEIKKINIPRYDNLLSSIKAKKASLNLINQISMPINHINAEIEQKESQKNEIQITSTFNERNKKESNNDKNAKMNKSSLNEEDLQEDLKDAINFWNSPSEVFHIIDGIVIEKRLHNEMTYEYHKLLLPEIKNLKPNSIKLENEANAMIKNPQKKLDFETKLYKFFYYDEIESKWIFDSKSFDEFSAEKQINVGNSSTPLIFYANSKEEDVIFINSLFLVGQNPNLSNEDQIFVYAFCEKNLSMLHINIDFNNQEKSAIKPIFLLLHIPKNRQKYPNLATIIIQMYAFLFCISDLAIIIVDEQFFYQQIPTSSFLYSISHERVSPERLFIQNKNISKIKNISTIKNDSKNRELEISSDSNINSFINDKLETIFLIENEYFDYDPGLKNLLNNNKEYNKMISSFNVKPKTSIIDINNINTFGSFLDDMTSILLKSGSRFLETKNKFNCLQLANMSSKYIDYKNFNKISQLSKILSDRIYLLENKQKLKSRGEMNMNILTLLYEEINMFTPKFDIDFQSCAEDQLSYIRKETSQHNKSYFKSQLNLSSKSNLMKIEKLIKNKHYISKDQAERIIRSHQKFLKNELFNIIKSNCNGSALITVFDDNYDILKEQISNDLLKINDLFNKIFEKREKIDKFDPIEDSKKKTNYVLKETENLREIKVSIEIGEDLTSVIEQDF